MKNSDSNNPKVLIVMLNWNGIEDTKAAVKSLEKIKYPNYQLFILDNGSNNDEYKKLSAQYRGNRRIEIHNSDTNVGFAAGVNIGIKRSIALEAKYTLLLNNDVEVDPEFLTELVAGAEADTQVGVAGSKIFYFDKPDAIWSTGYHVNYFFPPLTRSVTSSENTEVKEVLGCSLLIRNDVFKKVGYFDEKYFAYGEESDFNFRVLRQKYKILYVPKSILWHKVSASTGGGFSPFVAYLKMKNKIRFAKKNLPLVYWPTYFSYIAIYFSYWQCRSILERDWKRSAALLRGLLAQND